MKMPMRLYCVLLSRAKGAETGSYNLGCLEANSLNACVIVLSFRIFFTKYPPSVHKQVRVGWIILQSCNTHIFLVKGLVLFEIRDTAPLRDNGNWEFLPFFSSSSLQYAFPYAS